MTDTIADRCPQLLRDLARIVAESLAEDGIGADRAREIGLRAADCVRETYGGEEIYIPTGLLMVIDDRDRSIWREFDGGNARALARKHGTSYRHMLRILAACRREEFERRQMGLF